MEQIEENQYQNKPFLDESKLGLVYLLYRSNNESIVKIGFTSKSAERRASNYTDGEWVVKYEYPMPIWLARITERSAHEKLSRYWLDPKLTGGSASEIFTCSLELADSAIREAYIEQFEGALRLLKLPDGVIQIIMKINSIDKGISLKEDFSDIFKIAEESLRETSYLKEKVKKLEAQLDFHNNESKAKIDALNNNLAEAKIQIESAGKLAFRNELNAKNQASKVVDINNHLQRLMVELDVAKLASQKLSALQDFIRDNSKEIKDIRRFSDRKMAPREFESIKENLAKSVKLIDDIIIRIR